MPRIETNDQRRERMFQESMHDDGRRQVTLSLSAYMLRALQRAGAKAGITNLSALMDIALAGYLNMCAERTAALKVQKQIPPATEGEQS